MNDPQDRDLKWVATLEGDFVACRSIRHQWEMERFAPLSPDEKRVTKPEGASQVIKRELLCLRCGTIRMDYFGRNQRRGMFQRIKSEYMYPRGYTFVGAKHNKLRPMSEDYNAELFRRSA